MVLTKVGGGGGSADTFVWDQPGELTYTGVNPPTIAGGEDAGDDLILRANTADAAPILRLNGNGVTSLTNNFRIDNGTESLPVIAFTSDIDTGIYRQGNNAIGFTCGGNEKLRVTSSLIIPLTDTTPVGTLDMGAAATGFGRFLVNDGAVGAPSFVFADDTNTGLFRAGSGSVSFSGDGVTRGGWNTSGLIANIINEITAAAGVTIDSAKIKDGFAPARYVVSVSSDRDTDLATDTGAHRMPAMCSETSPTLTIKSVRAMVGTVPTGSTIILDINKNGTTIFTTRLVLGLLLFLLLSLLLRGFLQRCYRSQSIRLSYFVVLLMFSLLLS